MERGQKLGSGCGAKKKKGGERSVGEVVARLRGGRFGVYVREEGERMRK